MPGSVLETDFRDKQHGDPTLSDQERKKLEQMAQKP